MSHFTKLERANIVNVDAFISANKELGLTEIRKNVEITDYYGNKIKVDVAIKVGKYDIALKKNDAGSYDMVADWWGLRTSDLPAKLKACRSETDLQDLILKYTTKHTIVAKYKAQGWRANIKEENDEFTIDLVRNQY